MAFCDQRGLELKDAIEKYAPTATPETEKKALLAAAVEWDARRRENLDALCTILREQTGTKASESWNTRVENLRSGLAKFSEAAKSHSNPSEWATNFVNSNAAADDKFVTAVDKARVAAEARDYMVAYLATLKEETKNLETTWNRLVSDHATYQKQEEAVIEQVEALVRAASSKAQDLDVKVRKTIGDTLVAAKDALSKAPEGLSDAGQIPHNNELVIIGEIIEAFRRLTIGIEDQRSRFEGYFRQELGSVILLYNDFRKTTQDFIEKFGYKKVLESEETARRVLDDIVSNGGTSSANKADAQSFADAAKILIKGHVNNAKNTWDEFVTKHEGKFFGPIRPDFARALLDRDMFESKYERLQADNLHALAEKWRSNAREIWAIDFSGIPPNQAEAYKNALTDKLRDLDEILREPFLKRLRETMRTVVENTKSHLK
jgi:hypothetical protein